MAQTNFCNRKNNHRKNIFTKGKGGVKENYYRSYDDKNAGEKTLYLPKSSWMR
jgi:hypothetical protein